MIKLTDINIAQVEQIDSDAAAILSSAVQTTKKILERREALDRAGQKHQPLYVMAGETHDRPSHMLHHLLVLEGLKQADEKLLVGIERPSDSADDNYLDHYLTHVARVKPEDRAAHKALYQKNAYFKGAVDLYYTMNEQLKTASHSHGLLHYNMFKMHAQGKGNFCGLRTDAPRLKEKFLNAADPTVQNIMLKAFGEVTKNMSLVNQEGMYIRNRYMAQRLYDVAQKFKPRIALQLCGRTHVNGDEQPFHAAVSHHKEGLCNIFKQSAQPVLGVFLGPEQPTYQGLKDNEIIKCPRLPNISAQYNPTKQKHMRKKSDSFWGSLVDFWNGNDSLSITSGEEEMIYVNEKLDNMGLTHLRTGFGLR